MGKGDLLSGLNLGLCGGVFLQVDQSTRPPVSAEDSEVSDSPGGKRVQRNAQVSCLLWETLLPDWNGFAYKEKLERSEEELVAGRVRSDVAKKKKVM